MSEIKPLPCPFCGGVARKHRSDGDERNSYAATITYRCEDCFASRGASGDSSKGGYADNSTVEQRAIEKWNQRTESNEITELRARVAELEKDSYKKAGKICLTYDDKDEVCRIWIADIPPGTVFQPYQSLYIKEPNNA